MAKIKIEAQLLQRAQKAAQAAGYSSVEEFIVHVLEKETSRIETSGEDNNVTDQLRGLGYIE
jgi:hypothetical protein